MKVTARDFLLPEDISKPKPKPVLVQAKKRKRRTVGYRAKTPGQKRIAAQQERCLTHCKKGRYPWTTEEDIYLLENMADKSREEMAEHLNRSYFGVKARIERLRGQRNGRGEDMGEAIGRINLADKLKEKNLSYRKLAAGVDTSKTTISRIVKEGAFPKGQRLKLQAHIEAYLLENDMADAEELFWLWLPSKKQTRRKEMHNRIVLDYPTLKHFGLEKDPIQMAPGSDIFEEAPGIKYVLRTLNDAIHYQQWIALTGDIGAGKSTLLKTFLKRKAEEPDTVIWRPEFADPEKLTIHNIFTWIVSEHEQKPKQNNTSLQRQIKKILMERNHAGEQIALILDEAHHLGKRTMSALKNLWELSDDDRPLDRLLCIILVGQPQLKKRLTANYNYREVAERVAILEMPDPKDSIPAYLRYRIRKAGGRPENILTEGALKVIAERSRTYNEAGNILASALRKAAQNGEAKITKDYATSVTEMMIQAESGDTGIHLV
jgi:general secretion pathway protein A